MCFVFEKKKKSVGPKLLNKWGINHGYEYIMNINEILWILISVRHSFKAGENPELVVWKG